MTTDRNEIAVHRDRVCLTCANEEAALAGRQVHGVRWPDKEERTPQSVDMEFHIGKQRYVLEHTEVEFVTGQKHLESKLRKVFSEWASSLEKDLPRGARCELVPPAVANWPKAGAHGVQNALVLELRKAGLKVLQQVEYRVMYEGQEVGKYVADLVVNDTVLLELKSVKEFDAVHTAVCINYLKASGLKLCRLINFGKPRVDVRRIAL